MPVLGSRVDHDKCHSCTSCTNTERPAAACCSCRCPPVRKSSHRTRHSRVAPSKVKCTQGEGGISADSACTTAKHCHNMKQVSCCTSTPDGHAAIKWHAARKVQPHLKTAQSTSVIYEWTAGPPKKHAHASSSTSYEPQCCISTGNSNPAEAKCTTLRKYYRIPPDDSYLIH
jgi:hypothetical protein